MANDEQRDVVDADTPTLDVEAYDRFFDDMKQSLTGQAFLLTNDLELAKDLAQDALLRAWREWDTLDDPGAWVRPVLHNLAIGQWRRLQVRQRYLPAAGIVAAVEAPDTTALEVAEALRRLPSRHRRVLVLRAVVGLSTAEIAEELGSSEGSVRVWLSRARAEFVAAFGRTQGRPKAVSGD